MADQDSHPSRAEQRMLAVAKLKRAASLPRMKDGRRPPMHNEAVSEGEKAPSEEERAESEEEKAKSLEENPVMSQEEVQEDEKNTLEVEQPPLPSEKTADTELELDTELDDRPMSPANITKKRRSRSRSRSRTSKDMKGKSRAPQSPPPLAGDSSQDENPSFPSPIMLPMIPLVSPIPSHFTFLQQNRFLRSPTPGSPDAALFYPGTSPPTPLPTLDDITKGLMRSNSAGASAVGRRMAMHKLTGGTETYDPSPSPTPPTAFLGKLGRNNTVSGGERIAARQNMLSRLGTRITKEADAELASGAEDRGAPSPTPKRRRRRSRRASQTANPNAGVSDSEFNSTNPNTPAIPPTPLPVLQDHYAELRALSTTPNQLSSSRNRSNELVSHFTPSPPPLPVASPVGEESDRPEQTRRRSVLVEDPDDEDRVLPQQRYVGLPGTPQRSFLGLDGFRPPHSSDVLSNGSNSSDSAPASAIGVAALPSQRAPSRIEMLSSSPFMTPLKEKTLSDEEEEQVLYPGSTIRPRTPYSNLAENYDREISWVASPVPEIRMPIDDDEDDEDEGLLFDTEEILERRVEIEPEAEEEPPLSATSSSGFTTEVFDDISPRASSSSKSVFVESETSPDNGHSYVPASPSSAAPVSQASLAHASDGSMSPQFVPTRLSVASRIQGAGDRSPLTADYSDWDDRNDSPKRSENTSTSTWEKMKSTFSRAGSSTGRRSRTNSILTRERRDHTDSSVSRESGASLTSSKTDKGEIFIAPVQVQAPPLMQSPSASASILSLAPHAPPRGSVSPIPPASSTDMSKYQNAKLFPFPGMLRLEEERRAKGYPSATASSPDVSIQSNMYDDASPSSYTFANSSSQTPETSRERKLSHQNSDTRLVARYGADSLSTSPSSPFYPDYINISPSQNQNGNSYKLPMTLPGVKQWLSKNSKKKTQSPGPSPGSTVSFSPAPPIDSQSAIVTNKKPSLSDIFGKKDDELEADWEEAAFNDDTVHGKKPNGARPLKNGVGMNGTKSAHTDSYETDQTPRIQNIVPLESPSQESPYHPPNPSPPTRMNTFTPDPSSVSDYPAPTASESSSTTSSQYSIGLHGAQGPVVLERLDENLARGSRSPMWSSAIDEPPRKLILSSPVLQVVNPNEVKDRFLFLFNDILIIAKPVTWDHDNLMDTYKPSLPDRKYAVKNVVLLRNLRFCADRSDPQTKTSNYSLAPRNPLIRSFTSQFSKDPDHAIATLFTKSNVPDNSVLLGQLLFKTLDLDRTRLGEYLSRRTSKTVLKSYLDSFGFASLRVDIALRVFLHSVNVPRNVQSYGALEHLLDSFASRWYEANARFVAYDKDMATRLVRALVQLNDLLHDGIAEQPGVTDHVRRTVTSKEFQDAFRRYDPRYLVSDDVLAELYRSIYHERLCQACTPTASSSPDIPITIKRLLPGRLTYKAQSEPIILRLPQADPLFSIELYGQDLIFDPPVLQFSRSSEASFRVMGTSLGSKTMTMCRSGPNAVKYSGLPLSHVIVVERAFMRNTFQLAFLNQTGAKRRYMFSIDDTIIRNEWATSLRRHIDAATSSAGAPGGLTSPGALKFHKAAEATAFRVLQDTLMGPKGSLAGVSGHRANGSYSNGNGNGNTPSHLIGSTIPFTGPLHVRSKSRSKVYHRHGAGKNEMDLGHRSENISRESNDVYQDSSDTGHSPDQHPDGVVWTSRELEMQCYQNSSISLVLSFLQVGAPEHATS
ncbi:hypothetical protein B0H34DRAFT_795996 [Crassisporium funariophilum]|nr:hypothetical protein B0H34DRAFT_795996 [Crassisporium funariophilum]